MNEYKALEITIDDRGVAYVRLNQPEKRNALSSLMIDELTNMAEILGNDESLRAVVLSGTGKVFCAGGDLNWMKEQIDADREQRMREARKLALMLKALNELPKPLIGQIHGGAFGGGVGLACICDTAIADNSTKFGLTETTLGLIPATIGPYVLARMGESNARRVLMSARIFDASEAMTLGVIAQAVNSDVLKASVEAEIVPYLSTAPKAVAAAKALTRALGPRIDDEVIDDTIRRLADIWEGEEAAHGIQSFLTRKPAWWA
ncbi:MAG: crotonase/enoyl-CoA hydratase family protein [Pseudomonadota bacterium]